MIAYKGFNPGLMCLGYQFVMGKNVTEKANWQGERFPLCGKPAGLFDVLFQHG